MSGVTDLFKIFNYKTGASRILTMSPDVEREVGLYSEQRCVVGPRIEAQLICHSVAPRQGKMWPSSGTVIKSTVARDLHTDTSTNLQFCLIICM